MRILITADFHLHTWSSFNLNKASELSRRLKEQDDILMQIVTLVKERKIDSVELIGDIFHKVGEIPVVCLNIFDTFLSILENLKVPVFITVGNHDLSVRENPDYIHKAVNIFDRYQDNSIYGQIKIKRIGYSDVVDYGEVKGYHLVFLHKTPVGAIYNNYTFNEGVDWRKLSENNNFLFFGHIHQRQELTETCIIVGSPMHLTFGDVGDRGCYIVDTDTWKVEFIKLKYPEFRNVDVIEDVKDDYNYYKVKNVKGETNKSNVIAVSIPDFFEERLKSTTFDGIIQEWLEINKKDETYLEMIKPLLSEKFRLVQDIFKGKIVSVSIKNFMSVENISYKINLGFVLIKGQNEGFSSNGAGKTAIFEAIYWGLFGETTKGLTGDDVIRRGQKDSIVELALENDKGLYIVKRSRKKGLDVILPEEDSRNFVGLREADKQVALESLLGFDKNIFLASCYFSQENLVMLTSMSDVEKTNAITGLLGFEVYDDLYDSVFTKMKEFEKEINDKEQGIISISVAKQEWSTSIEYDERMFNETEAEIKKYQDKVVELTNDLTELKSKVSNIPLVEFIDYDNMLKESNELQHIFEQQLEGIEAMREAIKEKLHKAKVKESSLLSKLETTNKLVDQLKISIENLNNQKLGERCDKCGAIISQDNINIFRSEKGKLLQEYSYTLEDLKIEISNLDVHCKSIEEAISDYDDKKVLVSVKLSKVKQDIKDILSEREDYQKKVQECERYKIDLEYKMREIENSVKEYAKSIEDLEVKKSSIWTEKEKDEQEFTKCVEEEKQLIWQIDKIKKGIDVLDFWKTAFSPKGIRVLLLDRFCNEMNSITNNYLSSISSGFMSLIIKPTSILKSGEERNKLGLDIFMKGIVVKYESLSGGEKRRVDVALCLGLNDWISKRFRLKNGLLGFMILDEVFSFLDDSAEETIGSLLYQEGFNKAIFVISHTSELENYSSNSWVIVKNEGISKLEVEDGSNVRV